MEWLYISSAGVQFFLAGMYFHHSKQGSLLQVLVGILVLCIWNYLR
jgi:hypothetical protein